MKITINKKISFSKESRPYVVAEISGNHNKSLNNALKLLEIAAKAGADIVKLQTYRPDTITIRSSRKDFLIKDKKSLWKNQNLFNLYKKGFTPWEWHEALFKKAKKLNISWGAIDYFPNQILNPYVGKKIPNWSAKIKLDEGLSII